ncbi:alpha/beta hydrolase-fold protein [Corynebacterium sp. YIM 101645]|uniref:Alpha/beta hydrolase-fold protein n=1 Tax=Corynebacterium lemuris TaxID=1859292 RepID=A0ABT2FVE5_9CORY|nr:alpha/beta hydrolase-fold protein [Corynebacterium lemuris]MCS5478929.1 alpha/beta hydrolase-fold protein [Corynebacterium lemuris]
MTRTFFLTEDQIIEDYSNADKEALDRFWDLVSRFGTPMRELNGVRTTFVWRDMGANVPMHLYMNRITDKQNYDAGLMKQVPGTDIHVLTLELASTLLASYGFQPAAPDGERPKGPPPHDSYPTYLDTHNPRALVRNGINGLSLFEGPFNRFRREWHFDSGDITGTLFSEEVQVGDALRRLWLYLPAEAGEELLPLLTLFDAETWFGRLDLPVALEKAAAEGKIPSMAVLGVSNVDRADRVASLSANEEFLGDVSGPATIWAVTHAASRGATLAGPEGQIIAGQSLGGLSALVSVLGEPERYRYAIAASPSLWWEPGEKRAPADLGSRSVDWITEQFGTSKDPEIDTKILLSVGVREGLSVPRVHLLEQTMRYFRWDVGLNVYDGGHDFAWWRVALIDDLERIFTG